MTGMEALAASKVLGDLIKLLPKSGSLPADLRQLNEGLMSAYAHAASAFQEATMLREENQALKEECASLKDFAAKAEQYEIREVAKGIFAHLRKDCAQPPASAEKLCSNCFLDRQLTLLQLQRGKVKQQALVCQRGHGALEFNQFLTGPAEPDDRYTIA